MVYFVYYVTMKLVKKEKIPPIAYLISVLAIGNFHKSHNAEIAHILRGWQLNINYFQLNNNTEWLMIFRTRFKHFQIKVKLCLKEKESFFSVQGFETETSNFALNGCSRVSKNQKYSAGFKTKSRLIPSTLWIGCFHKKRVFWRVFYKLSFSFWLYKILLAQKYWQCLWF